MFLLIRALRFSFFDSAVTFTFHNVSINSGSPYVERHHVFDLHSTMFLLILLLCAEDKLKSLFTFHNVSINSQNRRTDCHGHFSIYIPQCFY